MFTNLNPIRIVSTLFLCLIAQVSPAVGPVDWHRLTLRDTDGKSVSLGGSDLTVVCFLGTECPLARLYGPRLQEYAERFADRGVAFLGVNSNVQDSPSEIDAYVKRHDIKFAMVKDADQSVADAFQATRTPEVFLVDSHGLVLYQGRIDDQYEPGIARANPTQNDLVDAIEAALAGNPISEPRTVGVGCLITRTVKSTSKANENASVTFTRDIAPILNEHCIECHRDGEIAPMALTDYDEVVGWGQMILEVIDQKRMPPWHADPAIGHFVGQRHMPASAREMIATWLDDGMPQGDPADLPDLPQWNEGWQFASSPDFEIAMRDQPFAVPADGIVEYQYFVVDPNWTEDRWVQAAQVVPGNASVVHHAIVFIRPPDDRGFRGIGWLSAYVPGQRAAALPDGHAVLVPAGSKFVFQMHYTPNGHATSDITRVGIWTADAKNVTHEVFTQMAIDHEFEIPPGAKDYAVEMSVDSFPPDSRMLGITPHMHLRGKSFQLHAKKPNGELVPLLSVPHYDFNWQHWYEFAEPVDLKSIDALKMRVTFDNSATNPFNPAPQDYVSWGDQTWEEMAVAFFGVAIPRGGARHRPPERWTDSQIAEFEKKIEKRTEEFFAKMDLNRDGVVERDETPVTFRRFGFSRIDRNGDRLIQRDEVRAEAGERL